MNTMPWSAVGKANETRSIRAKLEMSSSITAIPPRRDQKVWQSSGDSVPWEAFGWHWEITPRVAEALGTLHESGNEIYIWNTPQIEAIEWLINRKINVPIGIFITPLGEELFFKVAGLYALAESGGTISLGDLQKAITELGKAEKNVRNAVLKIISVPDGAKQFYYSQYISTPLEGALIGIQDQIRRYEGLRDQHAEIYEKLRRSPMPQTSRPPELLPDIATINAADIYLNATGMEPNVGNPRSFKGFLERFVRGIPGLYKKDMRDHAELVTRTGGYKGTPASEILKLHPTHPTTS